MSEKLFCTRHQLWHGQRYPSCIPSSIQSRIHTLKHNFFSKFSNTNPSLSKSGFWWKIPNFDDKEELASPSEVWEWIENQLKINMNI